MIDSVYPIIGIENSFPFYVTGAGICEPEFHVTRVTGLVSHQFLYTKSGRGIAVVGSERFLLKENSLLYLSPGVPHEYFPEKESWTTCWVVFRGCNLAENMRSLGFGSYALREDAVNDEIRSLFSRILAAAKDPLGAEKSSQLMYELVLAVRRALFCPKNTAGGPLDGVLEYIDAQFMRDITLEQLSELAGVSLQHFCRIFRARTGIRPMEYLARRRIAQAKNLLWNTNESIAAIGAKSGYPDPTYFGMVFKKYEGISPSEFRRQKGSGVI